MVGAAIGSAPRFVLDGTVLFAVDSAELLPAAKTSLDNLATEIAEAGLSKFRVVGHTDSTGDDAYNLTLLMAPAISVRDYLNAQDSLADATITAEGRGEAEPIADNATEETKLKIAASRSLGSENTLYGLRICPISVACSSSTLRAPVPRSGRRS